MIKPRRDGRSSRSFNLPSRPSVFLLATFALLFPLSADVIKLPPESNSFKQDAGAEIANGQCLLCHSVEYVSTQPPLPRSFWKSSVEKMQQKYGATIPEAQIDPLLDYLARNYGSETNLPSRASAPSLSSPVQNSDGARVAAKYGCLTCHSVSAKIIGPAYREIASKYQADPAATAKIEDQIHKGGSGKWGPIIMPPFPQVTPSETKLLIDWILSAK